MTWQPIDCHAHTTISDGSLAPAALVEMVRARGVRPSIADHISTDVRAGVKSVPAVREYLDLIEALGVGRGGEFCWHDGLWREIPDELWSRFTHHLGSLHAVWLPGVAQPLNMFTATLPEGLTPAAYMDVHLDNVERMMAEMPVDIFAHPTLVPIPLRALPPEELWTEGHEERLVEAVYRAGIVFEVSSRYRPHRRIVQRAFDRGVRLSLGSDGHAPEQVGDLSFPLAMVRAVGARTEELFDPWVHGSRVLR